MSEPITTALRGLLCARPLGDPCWDAMDAVDAVHAALEAENAALRAKVEELDNVGGTMHDGGSITDELRAVAAKTECANGRCEKLYRGDLDRIADRIDAAHESACKRERGEGIKIAEEAALEEMEHEYVKIPLDADGEPIRIGDVMDFSKNVRNLTVLGIGTVDGGCSWGVFVREGDDYVWYNAHFLRHYHAPTVEDVLTEFGIDWEHESDCEDRAALLKEYAAKLRLAEEKDA